MASPALQFRVHARIDRRDAGARLALSANSCSSRCPVRPSRTAGREPATEGAPLKRPPATWIAIAGAIVVGFVALAVVAGLRGPQASVAPTPTRALATAVTSPGPTTVLPSEGVAATNPPVTAVLVAAGDIASCTSKGDDATARLLDDMPGTIVTLGDNVYPSGTATQFRDCYGPTWGRQLVRTRPAPGNHDYLTSGAAAYFDYFGAAAGDPATGYYAYDLGAWRIYALNSNCGDIGGCGTGSPEVAWLQGDLADNPHQCVLAYWHDPRYSSGRHGSNAAMSGLWDTLHAAGAEIVLSAHDHTYERFAPQSDSGELDPETGLVQFVVGTGGFSHYEFPRVLPNSRARNDTAFGVLELTLAPDSWSSSFVPIAGQTYSDTSAGSCH